MARMSEEDVPRSLVEEIAQRLRDHPEEAAPRTEWKPTGITGPVEPQRMASPVYPPNLAQVARAWAGKHHAVGVVSMPIAGDRSCMSCGGEGVVYLRLLRDGPTAQPRTNAVPSAWMASTPATREGWWVIERTEASHCPKCGGSGQEPRGGST